MATAQGLLCSITTQKKKQLLTDSSHARCVAFRVRMRTALEILLHTLSSSGSRSSSGSQLSGNGAGHWPPTSSPALSSPQADSVSVYSYLAKTLLTCDHFYIFYILALFVPILLRHLKKKRKKREQNTFVGQMKQKQSQSQSQAGAARGKGQGTRVFAGKAEIADSAAAALQLKKKKEK